MAPTVSGKNLYLQSKIAHRPKKLFQFPFSQRSNPSYSAGVLGSTLPPPRSGISVTCRVAAVDGSPQGSSVLLGWVTLSTVYDDAECGLLAEIFTLRAGGGPAKPSAGAETSSSVWGLKEVTAYFCLCLRNFCRWHGSEHVIAECSRATNWAVLLKLSSDLFMWGTPRTNINLVFFVVVGGITSMDAIIWMPLNSTLSIQKNK